MLRESVVRGYLVCRSESLYSNTILFRFTEYISESSRPKYRYIIGCSGTSDETIEGGWNVCDEASYLMKHG